ncbi:MAG: c-type cytochrome [Terracidiphilus sp.]
MKSVVLLFAAISFAIAASPAPGRTMQEVTPAPAQSAAPAQAAAQAPAPPAPPPPTVPMAPDTKNPIKPTAASQAEAKTVYERDCALCHGDNGNGKTEVATSMNLKMGDWTDPKALAGKRDGELFDIIRTGWGENMPPEQTGRATDAEVWNMVIYIRGLSKAAAAAGSGSGRAPLSNSLRQKRAARMGHGALDTATMKRP